MLTKPSSLRVNRAAPLLGYLSRLASGLPGPPPFVVTCPPLPFVIPRLPPPLRYLSHLPSGLPKPPPSQSPVRYTHTRQTIGCVPGSTEWKWCWRTAIRATLVTMATPISCSRRSSQRVAASDDNVARWLSSTRARFSARNLGQNRDTIGRRRTESRQNTDVERSSCLLNRPFAHPSVRPSVLPSEGPDGGEDQYLSVRLSVHDEDQYLSVCLKALMVARTSTCPSVRP